VHASGACPVVSAEELRSAVPTSAIACLETSAWCAVALTTFARASVATHSFSLELDAIYEATPAIEDAASLEGITLESLSDLRASKLTCILSRSEPRDLVDLLFLDRAGFPPEDDVQLALRKDAAIDPGVLAWLLGQFPLDPLPVMLVPMGRDELSLFRDSLRERFRKIAVPE
jgi:hypothetical protein